MQLNSDSFNAGGFIALFRKCQAQHKVGIKR